MSEVTRQKIGEDFLISGEHGSVKAGTEVNAEQAYAELVAADGELTVPEGVAVEPVVGGDHVEDSAEGALNIPAGVDDTAEGKTEK